MMAPPDTRRAGTANAGPSETSEAASLNASPKYAHHSPDTIEGRDKRTHAMWKFDCLDVASMDPEVHAVDFQIYFRIIQHANWRTREARISDERLAHQISRNRKALTLARKRLAKLGYLRITQGQFGRGTRYEFLADRINKRLDELDTSTDDEAEIPIAPKPTHSEAAHSEKKTTHSPNGKKVTHSAHQRVENGARNETFSSTIHLTGTPDSLPVPEESLIRARPRG